MSESTKLAASGSCKDKIRRLCKKFVCVCMKAIKSQSGAFIPFAIDLVLKNIEVVLTRDHSKRITMKRMPPTRIRKESHAPSITSEQFV